MVDTMRARETAAAIRIEQTDPDLDLETIAQAEMPEINTLTLHFQDISAEGLTRSIKILETHNASPIFKTVTCGRIAKDLEARLYFEEALEVLKLLLQYLETLEETDENSFIEKAKFLTKGKIFKIQRRSKESEPSREEIDFYQAHSKNPNPEIKLPALTILSRLYEETGRMKGALNLTTQYLELLPPEDTTRRLGSEHRVFRLMRELNMEIDPDEFEKLYFEILNYPYTTKLLTTTAFKQLAHLTRTLEEMKRYDKALEISIKTRDLTIAKNQSETVIEQADQKVIRLSIIVLSKQMRAAIYAERYRDALGKAEEIAILQQEIHTPPEMIEDIQGKIRWLTGLVAALPPEETPEQTAEPQDLETHDTTTPDTEEPSTPEKPPKTLKEDFIDWLLTVKKEVETWLQARGREDDPSFIIEIKKKKRGRHLRMLDEILQQHETDSLDALFQEFEAQFGDQRIERMTTNLEKSLSQNKINLRLLTDILEQISSELER